MKPSLLLASIMSMFKAADSVSLDKPSRGRNTKTREEMRNISKSQRVMRLERGHNIVAIGARRFERNRLRAEKAKNRYCNNIG